MLVRSLVSRPARLATTSAQRGTLGLRFSSNTITTPTASPTQEVIDDDAVPFRPPAESYTELTPGKTGTTDPTTKATQELGEHPEEAFEPPQFGPGPTTHFRAVQSRGLIGMPWFTRRIIAALGFRHRMQAIYLPHHPTVAGELLKVKELVRIDNVRRLDLSPEHKQLPNKDALWVNAQGRVISWGTLGRATPRGYKIVGNRLKQQGFDRNALTGKRALP